MAATPPRVFINIKDSWEASNPQDLHIKPGLINLYKKERH